MMIDDISLYITRMNVGHTMPEISRNRSDMLSRPTALVWPAGCAKPNPPSAGNRFRDFSMLETNNHLQCGAP